jgi:two-component system, NtrC family, response regulator HydG
MSIGAALSPLPAEHTALADVIYHRSTARWGSASPTVIVGQDARLAAVLERLRRFADSDSPVLVTGETGTGKELFACGLYLLSRRAGRPFIRVNCAQYHHGELMASELFGHRKGSFTGAIENHAGVFQCAHSGVVLLDEIAELSLAAQAMLLRVLGEGELVPVGETTSRRVDVRVIAATSHDLGQMVQAGRFRRDLYYRLRGLHLEVPPVRERGNDWELIREYYLRQLAESTSRQTHFSAASIDVLSRYEWPGNVRELKALVETAFHLSEGGVIEPRHFVETLEEAGRLAQLERVPFVDAEEQCYEQMANGDADFWQLVRDPYMKRELSRRQVRRIVGRGLVATRGSYKRLLPLFHIADGDYLRFMDFLRHHELKPDVS